MYFRSEKHRELFKDATKKMDKKDNVQMCIVYLLTAERKLWNKCRIYMIDNKIPIHRVRVGKCTEEGYALFCCAKDFCCGTNHIGVAELSDVDVIPKKVFWVICNAMAIRRFGLAIEQHAIGDGEE